MRRLLDLVVSSVMLVCTLPLFLCAALGIGISSRGPIFYRATRVGLNGKHFLMLKFRTMHVTRGGPVITAREDNRVFPLGKALRRLKIDELPQFLNVLRGDMAIVGPRPEDPKIVSEAYSDWMTETLNDRPGITSPGAIFYYACAEALIDPDRPEESYIEKVLPAKLALDRAYMDRATIFTDVLCIFHTAAAIVGEAIGRPVRPPSKDIKGAQRWVPASMFKNI